jgi:PhnB protein
MEMNPYVTFDGNCAEALGYYANVLGGQIVAMQKFGDIPGPSPFGPELADKVMHAQLRLGDRNLMASDKGEPGPYDAPRGFSLQVGFDSLGEAQRAFDQLCEGGEVTMPFAATFWAAGFGMCRDRFGMPWMVNCDNPA